MKRVRKLLLQALAIKIGVVCLGITILSMRYILGQIWFNPQVNIKDIEKYIAENTNTPADERNAFGQTGLMYAAGNGKFALAQLLILKGADVNAVSDDQDRNTALHIAVFNGDFPESYEIAALLIQKGARINASNSSGQRPVHYLLEVGDLQKRLKLMLLLKHAGADINVQNDEGNTMLHLAVNLRDVRWIQIIRKQFGSALRTDIRNKNQQTPLDLAQQLGFTGEDSVESALTDNPATFKILWCNNIGR